MNLSASLGSYTATHRDGDLLNFGGEDVKEVSGRFNGSVGRTETNWGNSTWSAGLNQEIDRQVDIDHDAMKISLGISDATVNWGTLGLTAQAKWGTYNPMPFDVSGFGPVSEDGKVQGSFTVTGRHLHPAGDPQEQITINLRAYRVQGLVGMVAEIVRPDRTITAAGRGSGRRGGGTPRTFDSLWRYQIDNRPWYIKVDDFEPVQPGEHPDCFSEQQMFQRCVHV